MKKAFLTLVACAVASVSFGYYQCDTMNPRMNNFYNEWDRMENRLYQDKCLRNQDSMINPLKHRTYF